MGKMILQLDLLELLSLAWNYPLVTGLLALLFTPPMYPVLVFFSPLLISTALCAVALISVGHQIESTRESETVDWSADWNAALVEEDLLPARLLNARNPENRLRGGGDGAGRGGGGERWLDLVQRFESQSVYNNRTKDSLLMDDIKAGGLKREFRADEGDFVGRQLAAVRDYDRSFSFRAGAGAVAATGMNALPESDSASMEVASIPDEVDDLDNFDDGSESQVPPIFLYNLKTGKMVRSVTYNSRAEDLPIGQGPQIAKPALISGPQRVKDTSPAAIGAMQENSFSTAKAYNATSAPSQRSAEILPFGSFSKANNFSTPRSLNEGSVELLPFESFSKSTNFGTSGTLNDGIGEPLPFGNYGKSTNFGTAGALIEEIADPLPFGSFSKPSNFSTTGTLNQGIAEPVSFSSFSKPSNFSATGALNERSVEPLPFGSFSKPGSFSINGAWNEERADLLPFGTLNKASSFSMSEILDAVERAQDDLDDIEPQRSIFERDMGATITAPVKYQGSSVGRLGSNFARGDLSLHSPIMNQSSSDGEFMGFSTAGFGGGKESPKGFPFSQSPFSPSSGGNFQGQTKHVENGSKGLTRHAASRIDNAVVYNASSEPQSAATAIGRQKIPAGQKRFSASRDRRISSPSSSSTRRKRTQLTQEQSPQDFAAKLDFRTYDDWNQMRQQSPSRFDR